MVTGGDYGVDFIEGQVATGLARGVVFEPCIGIEEVFVVQYAQAGPRTDPQVTRGGILINAVNDVVQQGSFGFSLAIYRDVRS